MDTNNIALEIKSSVSIANHPIAQILGRKHVKGTEALRRVGIINVGDLFSNKLASFADRRIRGLSQAAVLRLSEFVFFGKLPKEEQEDDIDFADLVDKHLPKKVD